MPSADDSQNEDTGNSRQDQLLRALAAAPRPDADALLARALPELARALGVVAPPPARPQPVQGDVVDNRYRLEEVLGSGGMGIVFAARHTSTDRAAALKWLTSSWQYRTAAEREAAVRRFQREVRAAGRIRHANVVEVFDAGSNPSAPYYVMEKLEGETLRARMERGKLSWSEALELLVPAMRGVVAAHKQGVVHRDLKPDNIFLARQSDGAVVPKVLDFGLSGLRVPDAGEGSLTRTGTLLGTPAYMPLEQLRGERTVDVRSDVYALGVILYEMLSGKRPYRGRNAADFAAVITSQLPTWLGQHCPELRGTRAGVVMRALARAPEDRYPNVEAFLDALSAPNEVRALPHWRAVWVTAGLVAASAALFLAVREARTRREPPRREPVVLAPELDPAPAVTQPVPTPEPKITSASAEPAPPPPPAPSVAPAARTTATPRARRAESASTSTLRREDFSEPRTRRLVRSAPTAAAPEAPAAPPRLELGRDQF